MLTVLCGATPALAYDTARSGEYNQLALGASGYVAAVDAGGSLWMWGSGFGGQLGNGSIEGAQQTPVKVMDNVVQVSCCSYPVGGNGHTAAIKADGSLWTWGVNSSGQLGNGGIYDQTNIHKDLFQTVPYKVMDNVVDVSCTTYLTAIQKTDGSIWMTGLAGCGEMGTGEINSGVVKNFRKINLSLAPKAVPAPVNMAYAATQTVSIDGNPVELQAYALKDAGGNPTNYVKLRDVAHALNGTAAQFSVGWDGNVNIVTGSSYTANDTETAAFLSGDRTYTIPAAVTKVNGEVCELAAISLTDDNGGSHTCYQLRDLGRVLGFHVGWSAEQGIFIETNSLETEPSEQSEVSNGN